MFEQLYVPKLFLGAEMYWNTNENRTMICHLFFILEYAF